MASLPERNLVLVHSNRWQDRADFETIKGHVEALAPDIAGFIASNDIPSSITRKRAASRPTLIFSPIRLLSFKPARGKLYAGTPMSKIDEMRRLDCRFRHSRSSVRTRNCLPTTAAPLSW